MKIYNQDIKSEIESWYLKGSLSKFQSECEIFVNPKNKYIYDKIIIVTEVDYDYSRFIGKNFIIGRFPLKCSDYVLLPYKVSSLYSVIEPFRKIPKVLYPESLTADNCEIVGDSIRVKYNYRSVEKGSYLGYLTQTGFIASIIGIL